MVKYYRINEYYSNDLESNLKIFSKYVNMYINFTENRLRGNS